MKTKFYPIEKEEQFIYAVGLHAKRSWIARQQEGKTVFFDSITNEILGYEEPGKGFRLIIKS